MLSCDNDSSMGAGIGVSQCFKGEATVTLTIEYNDIEKDVLHLCPDCARYVTKDARKHGYKVIRGG